MTGQPRDTSSCGCEERLNSWKEIAAYLNRTIRTAQRWERTEALPIHRHGHDKRDSVYAYKPELDAWWTARRVRLEHEPQPEDISDASAVPKPKVERISRTWLRFGFLIAVALTATGVWLYRTHPRLAFGPRDWVLIADFDNQTGDALFDRSLLTAFTAAFQQSAHANVIPGTRIEAALKRMGKASVVKIDEQTGSEICLRENAKGMIACSIARNGRGYLLVARLVEPKTGETVRSYLEYATDKDQVIGGLGKLAGKIRGDLGESLRSTRRSDRPLPELTTASLQALKLYAEGRYLWQKGQYGQAVQLFHSALDHDPDFAMAHASLGNAYFSHIYSDPARGKEHYQKALQRSDRLTDRERLYIQATYQSNLGHVEQAVELFKVYLRAYPDDSAARYRLGTVLQQHDRYTEAVEHFQEAIRLDPSQARTYVNLATSYRQLGDSAKALAAYAEAFALEPEWITVDNLNHEYGFALVWSGHSPKAREVFALALNESASQASGLRSLALLDMYEGKYRDAASRLRECILLTEALQRSLNTARNRLFLSILLDGQGDKHGHMRELDRAARELEALGTPQNWLSARIGANYARAGVTRKAERLLRTLDRQVDRENPTESSELHRLAGEIALAHGDNSRALELLRVAERQFTNPLTTESLAHAYEKAGDTEHAIACYERLIGMGQRALGWEPQQVWIAAHLHLAEGYLSRGERAKAAELLDTLARRWKDADADLPLLKRMVQLQMKLKAGD
jgi:eukaryotic-like serine/threonine-protein kinase